MLTLKELQEQRNALATRIREIADSFQSNGEQWTDSTQEANWEQLNADYDQLSAEITQKEAARTIASRAAELAQPPQSTSNGGRQLTGNGPVQSHSSRPAAMSTEEKQNRAFAAYCRAGLPNAEVADEDLAICRELGYRIGGELAFSWSTKTDTERLQQSVRTGQFWNAAMTSTTGSSGGHAIPAETFMRAMEINLLTYGSILQVAEIINTPGGEKLKWPTFDDTANSARLVAESTAVDDNAGGGASGDGGPNPTLGEFVLNDYKYTSDTLLVPYELLEDSPLDLPSILGAALGERLARKLNADCTTGAGSTLPYGIVTRAGLGVTSGSTTDFTADNVISLQHSVDPAYRNGGAFMCHDGVISYIRRLKDANGVYLWQSGMQAGIPDTIFGSPVVVNQAMSNTFTTGQKLLLYGQMKKYKVRRIGQLRFYRLQERYRQKDQDGFVAFLRADGDLLDAGTDPVKYLRTA